MLTPEQARRTSRDVCEEEQAKRDQQKGERVSYLRTLPAYEEGRRAGNVIDGIESTIQQAVSNGIGQVYHHVHVEAKPPTAADFARVLGEIERLNERIRIYGYATNVVLPYSTHDHGGRNGVTGSIVITWDEGK